MVEGGVSLALFAEKNPNIYALLPFTRELK